MSFFDWLKAFINPNDENLKILSPLAEDQTPRFPPTPQREDYDTYKNKIFDVYKNQLGPAVRDTTDLQDYFPILQEELLKYMYDTTADKRPGTEYLLPLQALFESTGGRATKGTRNLFGTLPQGEGGAPSQFGSFKESIDYQLGPSVLGGGVGGKLNILQGEGPITEDEIVKMYESYNPNSPYRDQMLEMYRPFMEKR